MQRNQKLRRQRRHKAVLLAGLALAAASVIAANIVLHRHALGGETWNGLAIAQEHRCSPYDRADYPDPQSVEDDIVNAMGDSIYGVNLFHGRPLPRLALTTPTT